MRQFYSIFFFLFYLIFPKASYSQDGSLDPSFNVGTGANYGIMATAIQKDGKIIIGGLSNFTSYNGIPIKGLARLNTDGSLDENFKIQTAINEYIGAIAIQSDGKIIVGGNCYFYNKPYILRLNIDGSLDASFNVTNIGGWVNAISIQSDGKIVIGGIFSVSNGYHLTRLNIDGSLDASFKVGTDLMVNTIAIQDDGKIIIGGEFTSVNSTPMNRIARLNTDGSLDGSFNIGTGADYHINTIAIQKDGKVLIGGNFTTINNTLRNHLARLNVDGSLDATFNIGSGAGNAVYAIAIQRDEKIIIGGVFSNYNSTSRNHLARLNIDGSLDVCFNSGMVTDAYISTLSLQSDGKIIVGGYYPGGGGKNHILRLIAHSEMTLGRDTTFCTDTIYTLNPDNNSSSSYLWLDGSTQSTLTVQNSGTYWVRTYNGTCIKSDTINIIIDKNKFFFASASKDTVDYLEGIQFMASGNILSYQWNFNDGTFDNSNSPYHTFITSGEYNVIVEGTSTNNCRITKNLPIVVKEVLFIPNLITPNNDSLNDNFKIIYSGKEGYHLEIFNRWGKQVFNTIEKSDLWEGDTSDGIYYYNLYIGARTFSGWVQVIK